MAKVEAWDNDKLKAQLCKRLKQAKKYRERFEPQWRQNEVTVYTMDSRRQDRGQAVIDDTLTNYDGPDAEQSETTDMAVNYAWKFLRFIHSQMSANPPSVLVRPTSTDPSDRHAADAGDRLVRHAIHDKDMQELFDQGNLKCLTYGTSWIKCQWDPDAGDTFDFDEASSELTMAGDIIVYTPSTWDVWIDPDAKAFKDVRYMFERVQMPVEEAVFKWQEHKDDIEKFVKKKATTESELDDWRESDDVVEVFYYVEKALPINGMAGRMAYCLEDGTVLGKPTKNTNPGEVLGFAVMTDIDVPDQVYGKSFVEYVFKLQDLLNRLDTSFVENVASHNVVRMVLPENAEIEDLSLSNSSWDYVKITGNAGNGPYFVQPPSSMPDAHRLRENLISSIQELAGVNDSMMGVQKREMSGFSMQTAIDAGNQTRRRLFNKYTLCVRDVFRMYLANVREFWSEPRTIKVLGKEKAFEAADIKGADINGGYDIVCEYGASLSLDPARRREEIMQLMPVFEKSGVPTKTILSMLRLNELDAMYDRMKMAEDRQREIFDQMIATNDYIEPEELQDHAGMLDYAYNFLMTAEFKYLSGDHQDLLKKHVKAREEMAKTTAVQGQLAAPAPQPAEGLAAVPAPLPAPQQAVPAA